MGSPEHEEKKSKYPKAVILIIGNEFCERFSFYGIKAILVLYFVNKLQYSENFATMIYHIFSMACYFTPIIGAIISDSFLGKFRTIFYISIIYACGNIVLSVSALPNLGFSHATAEAIGMLGLALIAFGTGGIKPCVSSFGGDQFSPDQGKQLQRFFSFFYISINAGSLLSTFITPVLRTTDCLGEDECYTLAFGVPAGLMVTALILFLLGKPKYKIIPPKGNILVEVCSCICYAIKKKCQSKGPKRDSWLDYADDKYSQELINDIKPVLRVLFLYIPLPFFWALFDQMGSRWTLQASKMDGSVTTNFRIEPDQMQAINPLFIIISIPLFEYIIYPAFAKINFLVKPLQRMVVGGLLAAGSFVLAFFLQIAIEKSMPVLPDAGHGQLTLINGAPCRIHVEEIHTNFTIDSHSRYVFRNVPDSALLEMQFEPVDCPAGIAKSNHSVSIKSGDIDVLMMSVVNGNFHFFKTNDTLKKPEKSHGSVRVLFSDPQNEYRAGVNFTLKSGHLRYGVTIVNMTEDGVGCTNYVPVTPGSYELLMPAQAGENEKAIGPEIVVKEGGNYLVLLTGFNQTLNATRITMVEGNSISLFLQIPQYVVITFGEVMFSITGLEFSYEQAPTSMKAVLTAGWLMTTAFGNLIVVIISKAEIAKQSIEFIVFAIMLALDMCIFAVMAYFYKPVQKPPPPEEEKNGHPFIVNGKGVSGGKANEAFADDSTTKM